MRQRRPLVIACLVLLTAATMAPAIACRFINYDDDVYLTRNAHVRGPLAWANFSWQMTHQQVLLYHPLSLLSLTVDHAIWGLNASGYHAENVAIHIVSVVLLFMILAQITGETARPFIATALWAVHPLRVESVVWVAERKDVLAMVTFLAALWAYVRLARLDPEKNHPETGSPETKTRRWPWQAAIAIFLALSLAAKPAFFTLPALALLLDFWPLRRWGRVPARKLILEKIPMCAVAAAWLLWVVHIGDKYNGDVHAMFPVPPLNQRIPNAIVSYVRYLTHHLTLTKLATPYPLPRQPWPMWQVACCAALLIAITALALVQRRKWPWLTVGWLWYCIALTPMSGIRYIADYSMTDRYSYLPSIGLMIALIWSIPDGWVKPPARGAPLHAQGRALAMASVCVIAALAIFTQHQIGYWRDSVTLFTHSAEVDDGSLAEEDLGATLGSQKHEDEAIAHFERALEFYPNYAAAWTNLGLAYGQKQDYPRAIVCFRKALDIYAQMPEAHRGLGAVLLRTGQMDEAKAELSEGIRLDPNNPDGYTEMGLWYASQRRYAEAAEQFRIALKLSARDSAVEQDLGTCLVYMGKKQEADEHLRRAAQLRAEEKERAGNQ